METTLESYIADELAMSNSDAPWREALQLIQDRLHVERDPQAHAQLAASVAIIIMLREVLRALTDKDNPIEVRLR